MKQSDLHGSRAWTIRRAQLVDVPAVARLLGAPYVAHRSPLGDPAYPTIISATRLVLTHVALELGQFWVAADADDHVLAAVVLLPSGDTGQEKLQLALQLELGLLLPPLPVLRALPAGSAPPLSAADVPEPHWLLLAAIPRGGELMLIELLAAAMPAVDASGLPVLGLQKGPPLSAITAAGFEPLTTAPPTHALSRPIVQQPIVQQPIVQQPIVQQPVAPTVDPTPAIHPPRTPLAV